MKNYHLSISIWIPVEKIYNTRFNNLNYLEYLGQYRTKYPELYWYIEDFKNHLMRKGNYYENSDLKCGFWGHNEDILQIKNSITINNTIYVRESIDLSPRRKSIYNVDNEFIPNIKYIHILLPEFRIIESYYKLHRKNTFDNCDHNYPDNNCDVPDCYQRNGYIAKRWSGGETNKLYQIRKKKRNYKRWSKIDHIWVRKEMSDVYYDEKKNVEITASSEYRYSKINWDSDYWIRIRKEKSWKDLTRNKHQYQHNL